MMERIGGHLGLDVIRDEVDRQTVIRKVCRHDVGNEGAVAGVDLYGLNETAIHNEAFMLDVMSGSGYTPELIDISDGVLTETDVGASEPPRFPERWRHNLTWMLATIRARGVRHGDLKGDNIITRGNHPYVVDWQEAHLLGDVPPQRRPYSDSHLLMQHIAGTPDVSGQMDVPRVARRWDAVLSDLRVVTDLSLPLQGKTFLDIGCFQGDFVALAAAEGMEARGIDVGGFRVGENSIEIGRELWGRFPFGSIELSQQNVCDVHHFRYDVVMMFSTWPYLVVDYGIEAAKWVLVEIIRDAGVLYFETQLAGDGPGPSFLQTDDDVRTMLSHLGGNDVRAIGTFPVTNRPALRTVWGVRR